MKNLKFLKDSFQNISLMAFLLVASIYVNAQDSTNSIVNTTTTTTTSEEWYANPLYLVIGGVVLIIIIALIPKGNSKKS